MKIKFEKLDYQEDAINAVIDLFEGQKVESGIFTIKGSKSELPFSPNIGVSNTLILSRDLIQKNLNKIQLKNGIKQTILGEKLDFCIDMETGTGKTYVYLRTIMELNKKYGFTKFIIVVPSIAIREGVLKSLEITQDDFSSLYQNQSYNYFEYDSNKTNQIREFATNTEMQIMVINIQAFNKGFTENAPSNNIIHQPLESLNGEKPIDLIAQTNPIVIVDEPQSVMSGESSRTAMKYLNALATFRYSATHKEKINYIYKLDAVDAFNLKLVKQIAVSSPIENNTHNEAYVELISVDNSKSPTKAKIKIDVAEKGGIKRKSITVKQNDSLYKRSGRRDVYSDYIINDIYAEKGREYIDFTSNDKIVKLGQCIGGLGADTLKRSQIKTTIEEHLEKELILKKRGIKVLSLFFIDKVANYRIYNDGSSTANGKYAKWFEEECFNLLKKPKYYELLPKWVKDTEYSEEAIKEYVAKIHNGYFSIDKKGNFKDTLGESKDDKNTYELIMKDKEALLSFDSDLRFIFSHSALKEGWDNPNVFQICTLNETKSEIKKRQEIGRGLRIAVNQEGKRVYGFDVNTLTIMANESYSDFADKLQKEYEEDAGYKFGYIEEYSFANLLIERNGQLEYLGEENSKEIFAHLIELEYIDNKGKILDKVPLNIEASTFKLEKHQNIQNDIATLLLNTYNNKSIKIKNAKNRKRVTAKKEIVLSDEFKELWDKIKYKTKYAVEFDTKELIDKCIENLKDIKVDIPIINIEKAKLIYEDGGIDIDEKSIEVKTEAVKKYYSHIPDLLSSLSNSTNLTRKTIAEIIDRSTSNKYLKINPQQYIDQASTIINRTKQKLIVDGIKYTKIGNEAYSIQELYLDKELFGYLNENIIEAPKSTHDYVIYDSNIEKSFVKDFEENENIKLYSKLPPNFKIDTPLGTYNPDWAIIVQVEEEEKLYFVVESKGTKDVNSLRPSEKAKIDCGKKHFKALGTGVELKVNNAGINTITEIVSERTIKYDKSSK